MINWYIGVAPSILSRRYIWEEYGKSDCFWGFCLTLVFFCIPRRLSFHEIPVSWNTNVVTIFPFPNWKLIFWARTWSTQNSGLRIDSINHDLNALFTHKPQWCCIPQRTSLFFPRFMYVSGASCWSFPIGTRNDSYICYFIMTLQGTNISSLKGSWEDDYVGYVRSPEN